MNLALFITTSNKDKMRRIIAALATTQASNVNGAAVVIYQGNIPTKEIEEIVSPLTSKFRVRAGLPVQANLSHSENAQIALLFSKFLLAAYAKYPGAWILMDEPAATTTVDWVGHLERQHASLGGRLSGKGEAHAGSLLPVGPLCMSLPFKLLKFLRFPTNESWRERGRFFFSRCGFNEIPDDQYIFSQPAKEAVASTEENGHFRAVLKTDNEPLTGVNPDWKDAEPSPAEIRQNIPIILQTNPTKKELLDAVELITGTRPHHFTADAKLKAMIEQQTATPV